MPIYEFRCEACGHIQEALRRVGEGAEGLQCPECGSPDLALVFSRFSAGASAGAGARGTGSSCGSSGFG